MGLDKFEGGLKNGDESGIFNDGGRFRRVDTGGLRNERPLTEEEKEQVITYAVSLGMPENKIVFIEYGFTAYGSDFDILKIGTDVLPLNKRVQNPNSNISLKGTIAHELIGHREAQLNGFTQSIDVLEEAQASIRAARFAPDIDEQERMDLLKDAIRRLRNENIKIRDVKNKLYINERGNYV
jgi:hypothetical protein